MTSARPFDAHMAPNARAEKASATNPTLIGNGARMPTDGGGTFTAATTHQSTAGLIRASTHCADVSGSGSRRLHEKSLATVWAVHAAIGSSRKLGSTLLETTVQIAIQDAERMYIAKERAATGRNVTYERGQISVKGSGLHDVQGQETENPPSGARVMLRRLTMLST
jgi:hypothetical protein